MTDDWHPDLQEAAAEYSPGYVITAFAVKDKIDSEGYPGIHFVDSTESYMKQVGSVIVAPIVEKHMNRRLRKQGFK